MSTPETNPKVSGVPAEEQRHEIMPTLFGDGYGLYEVRKGSFVVSFLLNSAIVALLVFVGSWTFSHAPQIKQAVTGDSVDLAPYVMPLGSKPMGGGGGGGSHDVNPPSKGALPKLAKTQIAPPTVTPIEQPKLAVMPTVVAPPNIPLPQSGQLGDPLAKALGPLSNGGGTGSGIGTGSGTGVGSGHGPGVGNGSGGGYGGGAYRVGNGVSAPKIIYRVEPEFSEEARKAKYFGSVILQAVVGTDGKAHEIRVARSAGMGLDEKAIAAFTQWRFEPGHKDGQPVATIVAVEVNFHLY